MMFLAKADIAAADIAVTVKAVQTQFYAPNFAIPATLIGGAGYYRCNSEPDVPAVAKIRSLDRWTAEGNSDSANGGWWVLAERCPHADHFGIVADGTDVSGALNDARLYAYKMGDRKLRLGAGTYGVADTLFVGGGAPGTESAFQNCALIGCGHSYLNSSKSATTIKWVGASDADKAVVEVAGRISGVEVGGFVIDCDKKARDGLVVKSAYGSHFHDIWAKNFRRDGVKIGTQLLPSTSWYSSFNRFVGIIATTDHVETSGAYETCAWNISGADGTAGAWGNTYMGCRGSVYRDATNTAWPRVLYCGYTDSSTFLECDFTLAWSGLDAEGNVVPGTPGAPAAARGHGVVYDGMVKHQFPLNLFFYGCSIVGNQAVIEVPGTNEIGSIIYNNQPTRDWEAAPTHPRIRGFNDRGYYFGDIPVAIRGDHNRLRFYQQNLQRWVDFIMNSDSSGSFSEFLIQYHNAGGADIPALGVNAGGEVVIHQGLRSFLHTLDHEAVVAITPARTDGIVSLTNVGAGIDRSIIFSYRVTGTHAIAQMATGGSANVEVTTGELVPGSTTGTSGKITVSVYDGKIYLKNRTGVPVNLRGTYLS